LLKFDQALRSYKLGAKESVDLLLAPKPELNSPEYGFGFFIEHKCRRTDKLSYATGIMAAAIIGPEIIHV